MAETSVALGHTPYTYLRYTIMSLPREREPNVSVGNRSSVSISNDVQMPNHKKDEEQLKAIGERIRATFEALLARNYPERERDAFKVALEDAAERFQLWAVNLGLYTIGHSSLEYRLGDAPTISNYVRDAMTDLERYLCISKDLFY